MNKCKNETLRNICKYYNKENCLIEESNHPLPCEQSLKEYKDLLLNKIEKKLTNNNRIEKINLENEKKTFERENY